MARTAPTMPSVISILTIAACAMLGGTEARAATCATSPTTCDPYVVTLQQVPDASASNGFDVEATSNANGEFDLTGLALHNPTSIGSNGTINPAFPQISFGVQGDQGDAYDLGTGTFSGPANYGSGNRYFTADSNNNGPFVGVEGSSASPLANSEFFLTVPRGYTSGTSLATSQDIFKNTTLALLGITPGTYKWTWGGTSGTADQSFTLDIIAPTTATPLPTALPLFASGLGALGLLGWRRKRKARAGVA